MKQNLQELREKVEIEIAPIIKEIDKICERNSKKVLDAFQECHLQEQHLNSYTGYGIDEPGRDKIEEINARAWWHEQIDLTLKYYVNNTDCSKEQLKKLINWCEVNSENLNIDYIVKKYEEQIQ